MATHKSSRAPKLVTYRLGLTRLIALAGAACLPPTLTQARQPQGPWTSPDYSWHIFRDDGRWYPTTFTPGGSVRRVFDPPGGGPDSVIDAHWSSAVSGTWSDATRWSTNPTAPNNGDPSGSTYHAYLDAAGAAHTVTLNTPVFLDQLSISSSTATLAITTGGILSVPVTDISAGTLQVSGGQLIGGSYTLSGTGKLTFGTDTTSLIDGVSITGNLLLGRFPGVDPIVTRVRNGIGLTGTITLGGSNSSYADGLIFEGNQTLVSGTYLFAGAGSTRRMAVDGDAVLTIGPGATVRGGNGRLGGQALNTGTNTVINQGLISADSTVGALTVGPAVFLNTGSMTVEGGGTLTISSPSWSNTGTIVSHSGTLNIGGSVTTADLGSISSTGGLIQVTGTLNNTGNTLTLTGTTGDWTLSGGLIQGGTITQSGGHLKLTNVNNSRLRDVTVNGDLDLGNTVLGFLTLSGTTALNGTINAIANSVMTFNTTPTLQSGTISMRAAVIDVSSGQTLTIAPAAVITTGPKLTNPVAASNNIGGERIDNQGRITASGTGNTTTLNPNTLNNSGVIETLSDAELRLSPGSLSNTGLIRVNGGTLTLGGTFTMSNLGTWERTGGTVRLTGILNNPSSLTLDSTTGSWQMGGGEIRGGTVNLTQGSTLLFDPIPNQPSGGGTLRGVTLNGDLILPQASAFGNFPGLSLYDGLTLNGTIHLTGESTVVFVHGSQTWDGGIISFEGNTGANRSLTLDNGNILTIGPNAQVRGGRAYVGYNSSSSTVKIVNQGKITADSPGQVLSIIPPLFTNVGTLETTNLSTLEINGNWSSSGLIKVNGGTINMLGNFNLTGSTFQRNGGTINIQGTLTNTGNTINLDANAGSWVLGGARIIGGAINLSGGSTLQFGTGFNGTGGRLSGVTLTGDLFAPNFGGNQNALIVDSGFTYNGTMTIRRLGLGVGGTSGTVTGGTFVLDSSSTSTVEVIVPIQGVQTLSPTTVVRGGNASIHYPFGVGSVYTTAALVNKGLVSADVSNQYLTIQTGSLDNQGILEAKNGGILATHFDTTWKNSGIIRSSPGSTVYLGGKTSTPFVGTLQPNGGALYFASTLDNAGSTLTLNSTTGSWSLGGNGGGAFIKGGTVNMFDGAQFIVHEQSRFTEVQINGDINVADSQGVVGLLHGVDLNGTIHLAADLATVNFYENVTFPRGTIAFEGTSGAERQIFGSGIMTLGSAATIRGGYGMLFTNTSSSIINNGLISADVNGQAIRIFTERFSNYGTIEAINGGVITFVPPGFGPGSTGTILNEGLLYIAAGSEFYSGGPFIQTATGSLIIQLGAAGAPGHLTLDNTADIDGLLRVVLSDNFTPLLGLSYHILSIPSTGLTGHFSGIELPTLPGDLSWNTSALYDTGGITIVPAPGSLGLLSLFSIAAARRRRSKGGAL